MYERSCTDVLGGEYECLEVGNEVERVCCIVPAVDVAQHIVAVSHHFALAVENLQRGAVYVSSEQ